MSKNTYLNDHDLWVEWDRRATERDRRHYNWEPHISGVAFPPKVDVEMPPVVGLPATGGIHVVKPYKWNGQWVFDDPRVELVKEPFVAGADDMMDAATKIAGIENAGDGFQLLFSDGVFSDDGFALRWLCERSGGNVYRLDVEHDGERTVIDGWLCPALLLYYRIPPARLFIKACPADWSPAQLREAVLGGLGDRLQFAKEGDA